MKRIARWILISLNIFVLTIVSFTQEKEITMSEFWDYMRRSQSETKEVSFRKIVTIEMSDFPDVAWKPYSSWISEHVFPNRSSVFYTSRNRRTIIHIGEDVYSKELDGPWIHERLEKEQRVNQPAALYGHAKSRIALVTPTEQNKRGVTLIRAISKSWHVKDPDKDMKVNDYWYDENGVLVREESIGYTGEQWRREIVIIQYDPNIKIEAPIN